MSVIKLFSTGCERCLVVEGMLDAQGFVYEYHDLNGNEGFRSLDEEYRKQQLVMRPSQALPVLVQGDMLWEGQDAVVCLEEEELV